MIKVYIGQLLENIPYLEVLYPNIKNTEQASIFNEKIFDRFTQPVVTLVGDPVQADYLLIPHNFRYIKDKAEYIKNFTDASERYGKKILVFVVGDNDEYVQIPDSIVFRNSQYGYKKLPNEIIIPGFTADLAKGTPRFRRKGEVPVVGFCGWAGYASFRNALVDGLRNILIDIKSLFGNRLFAAHKKGVYFRKKAITALNRTSGIETNFIIRTSYGAHRSTIALDPEVSRKEYVDTMNNCDFALATKGDGNFSVRFYEALSLGRIPLLIDTDCVLPLEKDIDYSKFIVRVDYRNIKTAGEKVKEVYASMSEGEYLSMQRMARQAFEEYLKIDIFFARIFTREAIEQYSQA